MLRVTNKTYVCAVCGHEQKIKTNHYLSCMDYCKNCSWKGEGFGYGVRMFGVIHRTFFWTRSKAVKTLKAHGYAQESEVSNA